MYAKFIMLFLVIHIINLLIMKTFLNYSIGLILFFVNLCIMAQKPTFQMLQLATGYTRPTDIKNCGDDRIFIVGQTGTIRIVSKTGVKKTTPFLNIVSKVNSSGSEQGLLGLAFSPNYKTDGYFFVNYIKGNGTDSTVIARYSVDPADSNVALAGSEVVLLKFAQPYSNHNGGNMMFGKDGYLYISQGDGGSGGDPDDYGQNKNEYLGKMLRIDPFSGVNYAIPPTNPFVGQLNVKEEIWAWGLRNSWRCSFDNITGDMWIGDVGQNAIEEIDFQSVSSAGGENYGWRCYEASASYNPSGCGTISNYTFPVYEYGHDVINGCSVTGGYVYRGSQYNNMFGKYFFTDYCSGRIWSILQTGPATFTNDTIGDYTQYDYSAFGEDNEGELYLAGNSSGKIWHITDTSSCKPVAFFTMSDTLKSCGSSLILNALKGNNLKYQWYFNGLISLGDTLPSLTASANGKYSVQVTKGICSSTSDSAYVKLNNCTGISSLSLGDGQGVRLYPNPAENNFTILLLDKNMSGQAMITLYDNLGKIALQKNISVINQVELSTATLSSGIYFVEIKNERGRAVNKLTIAK